MDGDWRDWKEGGTSFGDGPVKGSVLQLLPVFYGEVVYKADESDPNRSYWHAKLNGKFLMGLGTIEKAKARVDWEIWNELRCIKDAYKRVIERRDTWETGWQ